MNGVTRIWFERLRQIEQEGWSASHDDEHENGELVSAAIAYALVDQDTMGAENYWPWEQGGFKPSEDEIRNLTKAGALLAAEIDRLLRARDANL